MTIHVDFYFDFSSSYSYLAQHRIRRLEEEAQPGGNIIEHLQFRWKPIALGAIFKARGHAPPEADSIKGRYIWRDIERTAAEMKLPFHWPRPFPFSSIGAARIFYALESLQGAETAEQWAQSVFHASFGEGKNVSDPEVLQQLAEANGHDADKLASLSQQSENKDRLRQVTDEAAGRGVFGAPTFSVEGELYWGADRIDAMLRHLANTA